MKSRKKLTVIVPLLIILVVVGYLFFGWNILVRLHPDRVVNNMAEFAAGINQDLDTGKESGVFFVSKDVLLAEIDGINDYICSMNGMVDQYSVMERLPQGVRVRLKYEISDNYYVYENYVNGKQIPADRPLAKQLAEEVDRILREEIPESGSNYEKELAIHDYVVSHCAYGYVDSAKPYAYRAYGVLMQHHGVCNGYAEALALLFSCAGIKNRIVTGYADQELHAWNQVELDGQWYMVDATWDDPLPDRESFSGHAYFNVTDDILGASHTWTKEDYPPCTVLDYNYFHRNKMVVDQAGFKELATKAFADESKDPFEVVLTDYNSDYDLSFLYALSGVRKISYSQPVFYGADTLLTFYVNEE